MNIIFISDTHSQTNEVLDGDVLVHCGDLTMMGRTKEYKKTFGWLNSLPHKRKLFVFGNHDFRQDLKYAEKYKGSLELLYPHNVIEVDGVRFTGLPYVTGLSAWEYNFDEDALSRIVDEVVASVKKADVLVTHSPPYGILDECLVGRHMQNHFYGHVGVKAYQGMAARLGAKIHAFGHIHEEGGTIKEVSGIKYVNASSLDDDYRIKEDFRGGPETWGVEVEI